MLSGGLANASTFFITFLLLQLVLLVNKELVRLAPTLLLFVKRRAKLVKEGEAPDEPAKYAVMWVTRIKPRLLLAAVRCCQLPLAAAESDLSCRELLRLTGYGLLPLPGCCVDSC